MWLDFLYSKNANPAHAGGIVYREEQNGREYLLVSARRFSFIWVLPKGRIKICESEEHAALREVKEESGVKASICHKIGDSRRIKWNFDLQVVAFYLMKFESAQKINTENRKVIWVPPEIAIKKLFYKDQRNILKQLR